MRPSRRQPDELRPVSLERGVVKFAEGSCFVKFGETHVLVTATLEDRLPPWLKGQGTRLDHRRIRHAAARHAGAHAARSLRRQAERPHGRNPAPDRAQPALGGRSQSARRAPDHHRLRRHPGRRRHPHRLDHRRLDRALRLPRLDEDARHGARWKSCATISRRSPAACAAAWRCSTSIMPRIRKPRPTPISSSPARAISSRCRPPPRKTPFSEEQLAALLALARKGVDKLIDLQKMAVM